MRGLLTKIVAVVQGRLALKMVALLALYFLLVAVAFTSLLLQFDRMVTSARRTAVMEKWGYFRADLAGQSDLAVVPGREAGLEALIQKLKNDSKVRYVVFYDRRGARDADGTRPMPAAAYFHEALGCDPEPPRCPEGDASCGQALPCREHDPSCLCSDLPALAANDQSPGVKIGTFAVPILDFSFPLKEGWIRVGYSVDTSEFRSFLRNVFIIVALIMITLSAAIIYSLHRMISLPITQMAHTARLLSQGAAGVKVEVPSRDELGQLAGSFNQMTDHLSTQVSHFDAIIANIAETVDHISKSTADMFSISAQQSSGATEQAASVYEASSTSKEIAASASRIADTAEEVSTFARETNAAANKGKDELGLAIAQVREVTERTEEVAQRMVDLGARSQKISGIIDIIKEISEQTNLLALNAAIEAAGAGEAGRRFAVVAQEIRRLAGRTLDATQTVRDVIEEIQSSTNSAVMVTEQSMKGARESQAIIENMDLTFQDVLEMVEKTLSASTQINLSTRQQTTACEQMVATIMEVSDVAAEVEKGAKESETALHRLRELSDTLKRLARGDEFQST
jgi:methyl-accepting chemotaxis protein